MTDPVRNQPAPAYTPGPLYVGNDSDEDGFTYYYVGPEDEQAARFYYEGEASGDRALADAMLYAAAPDLLEIVRGFDRLGLVIESAVRADQPPYDDQVTSLIHRARNAIARAEGKL